MEERKKKQLESKGIKIGSVVDALKLTTEEYDYIKFKLFLSTKLKQIRKNKNISQIQLAKIIKSSQSRVANMESCDPSVSIDLLIKSHIKLGVSIKDINAEFAKEEQPKYFRKAQQDFAVRADTSLLQKSELLADPSSYESATAYSEEPLKGVGIH